MGTNWELKRYISLREAEDPALAEILNEMLQEIEELRAEVVSLGEVKEQMQRHCYCHQCADALGELNTSEGK